MVKESDRREYVVIDKSSLKMGFASNYKPADPKCPWLMRMQDGEELNVTWEDLHEFCLLIIPVEEIEY